MDTHNDVADDKEVLVGVGDDVLEINFFSFACSNLSTISTMKIYLKSFNHSD